ncbi:hypothetical protein JOM56_007884 [Amanita muscaria]
MQMSLRVQWVEAYKAADEHGRTVAGGTCPSVGAAGGFRAADTVSYRQTMVSTTSFSSQLSSQVENMSPHMTIRTRISFGHSMAAAEAPLLFSALPALQDAHLLGSMPTEMISRFLSWTIAERQQGQMATATLGLARSRIHVDPDSVAAKPACRQSLGILESVITWAEGTPTAAINDERKVAAADLQSVDTVSPNSGTYLNEVGHPFETLFII